MHTRRLASFLLGGWIAGSFFVIFIAIQNFQGIDQLLETRLEPLAKLLDKVGRDNARALLRHQAAQLNDHLFQRWEQIQIVLGMVLIGCLIFATHRRMMPILLASLMLAMVVFLEIAISPEIAWLGRGIEFLAPAAAADQGRRLHAMQQIYGATEAAKLIVGGILAAYLFVFRVGPRSRKEVHPVDHADHSHVDG